MEGGTGTHTQTSNHATYHHQPLQSRQNMDGVGTHTSSSGNTDFALGGQSQSQVFSQGHGHAHAPGQAQVPQNNGGRGGNNDGGAFPNLHALNSLGVGGQGQVFAQSSHPFVTNQQVLHGKTGSGSGNAPDNFLNISQQAANQVANQSMGMACEGGDAGLSPEAFLSALSSIQQKIGLLQQMVPLLAQTQHLTNPNVQRHAAAAITELDQVAANIFQPAQQQHQLHNNFPVTVSPSIPLLQQQQQQQFSQLFGNPAFRFSQGQAALGGMQGMNNSARTSGGGWDSVLDTDGFNRNRMGATSNLLRQLVGAGVQQGNQTISGPAANSSSADVQGFNGGPKEGSALTGNNSGLGSVRATTIAKHHGSSRNSNQPGLHGGAGGVHSSMGGAVDMPLNMNSLRSSQPSSGGNCSSGILGEEEEVGGGGLGGLRDEDDDGDTEILPPGSYELVEMEAVEILAEHTHFCEICGKGFKRDANLRMHMRGHGDEYKSPAALARPDKGTIQEASSADQPKRFSCPFIGCKRNKKHRKFMPLKTVLCVKNHYRRSHCPKSLSCAKCKTKRFSVMADLKTHEKHCGCDKWQCSCGTTFSRKDKLLGHIGLFTGHTPALPLSDMETSSSGLVDGQDTNSSQISIPVGNHKSSLPPTGGYEGLSSGGISSAAHASMGLGRGGSGTGLGGMQGLSTRVVNNISSTGNGMSTTDVNAVGSENCPPFSSQGENLMTGSTMLHGLFSPNFLQNSRGGNPSSEAAPLH